MTTDQEEQAERRRVLLQDADVRNRSRNGNTGTYLSHTHIDDAGGRFAQVNAAKIVGQSPAIAAAYPAASAAHQTELPPEPSLGFSIDEMPGLESSAAPPVEATGDPADAPSGDDGSPATPSGGLMSERAGSSLSPDQQTDESETEERSI